MMNSSTVDSSVGVKVIVSILGAGVEERGVFTCQLLPNSKPSVVALKESLSLTGVRGASSSGKMDDFWLYLYHAKVCRALGVEYVGVGDIDFITIN
jgi:hypothetical protein